MNINFNVCNSYLKAKGIGPQSVKDNENIKMSETDKACIKHDTVSISPEAASFREIERSTRTISSDIENYASQEKINSLKAQIADGTYNVSAEEVADAILDRLSF